MFFWKVLLILGTKLCEIVYLPTAVLYFKELKNVTKRYPQQLGEPKNLRHKRSQAIFTCASDRLFLAIKIKEVQYQYLEPYIWAILRKNNKGLPLCIVLGHEVHGVVGALHILTQYIVHNRLLLLVHTMQQAEYTVRNSGEKVASFGFETCITMYISNKIGLVESNQLLIN